MSHWKQVYQQQILSDILQDDYAVEAWTKIFESTYSGHINTWDYQWMLSCWLQNSLSIHPRCNLVTNIGGGIDATHKKFGVADLRYDGLRNWDILELKVVD